MTFLKPSGLSIDTHSARYSKLNKKVSSSRIQLIWPEHDTKSEMLEKGESADQKFKRLLCEANVHRRRNSSEEAITCFRKCLQIKPGTLSVYIYLAKALENSGKINEAYEVLQECIFTNSENPKSFDLMVDFCMTHNRLEEAKMVARNALGLDPENLQFHLKLCKILFQLGEYQKVIVYSNKILSKCRGKCVSLQLLNVESTMKLLNIETFPLLNRCRDFEHPPYSYETLDSICEKLQNITYIAPKNVKAKILLADILTCQEKYEEAYVTLKEALDLDPQCEEIQNYMVDLMDLLDGECPSETSCTLSW